MGYFGLSLGGNMAKTKISPNFKPFKKKCLYCGKAFYSLNGKFCSKVCAANWKYEQRFMPDQEPKRSVVKEKK